VGFGLLYIECGGVVLLCFLSQSLSYTCSRDDDDMPVWSCSLNTVRLKLIYFYLFLKNKKNIILIYFYTKNTLKNSRYHNVIVVIMAN
jgi:hypothetical protein